MKNKYERRQVPIPDIMYHVTSTDNKSSILQEGIVPHKSKGACYNDEIGDKSRYGVYLTSDYEALIDIDSSFHELGKLIAFKVDVTDIKESLIVDEAFDMPGVFTEEDILEGMYDQFSYIYPGDIQVTNIIGVIEL